MEKKLRDSGIDTIGVVPWGTHFCQFYQTKEDLMDILIPFFKAGLESNEFCIWITSQILEVEQAKKALRKGVTDFDIYLEKGQIEIIPYTTGYINGNVFDPERAVNSWSEKLCKALENGYTGMRATGDTSWLEKEGWSDFVNYERKIDSVINKHQMIALCPYNLRMCSTTEVIDIVFNHQFSLIKRNGKWEKIENSGRKRAEEATSQAVKDWKQTFDAVPDLIFILDNECRIVRANKAIAARLGLTPEECTGLTCYHAVHGKNEKPSYCSQRLLLQDGLEHITEFHEEILGGNFLLSVSPLYDSEGKLTGSVHVARDITELKQAEDALKKAYDSLDEKVKERTAELEAAYKSLKENEISLAESQRMAHIGNWDWDLTTGKAFWSEEMYRIFGRNPQEPGASYEELLSYIHPDDREYVDKTIKKALSGEPQGIDYRIILPDGEVRVVYARSEVIFNEQNIPIRVKGIIQDITESKKAEEEITILANAVESSNDAILTTSLDGIITSWNKGAEKIYGYPAGEILGKNSSMLEPGNLKGEIQKLIEKIKQGKIIQNYETSRLRKDGKLINTSITLSPIFNSYGKFVAISAIIRDITERVKAEKALAKVEEARKKEIYHRVKNNLQVISSLLDLQASKFEDKNIIEAFNESKNRVISMAMIHEELYKSKDVTTLDFSNYLQKLTGNLLNSYAVERENVTLKLDIEQVCLGIDTAIPLGIIVNELVSNSLKYAFRPGQKGEISISLKKSEDHKTASEKEHEKSSNSKRDSCKSEKDLQYTLVVADNGLGIPKEIDIENTDTLGLQLIHVLVEQIDGHLKLSRNHGTKFTIQFNNI